MTNVEPRRPDPPRSRRPPPVRPPATLGRHAGFPLPEPLPTAIASERSPRMKKEMLINVLQPEECRIAIVEDGILEELYVERTSLESYTGNIYKGKIVNLEPAIQAAFVDFSVGRNGFLHVSDVEPQYYQRQPRPTSPSAGRDEPRRDRDRETAAEAAPARRSRGSQLAQGIERRGFVPGGDRDRDRGRDREPPRTFPPSRGRPRSLRASRALRRGARRTRSGVGLPPRGRSFLPRLPPAARSRPESRRGSKSRYEPPDARARGAAAHGAAIRRSRRALF